MEMPLCSKRGTNTEGDSSSSSARAEALSGSTIFSVKGSPEKRTSNQPRKDHDE
jgi:hypothetical protein